MKDDDFKNTLPEETDADDLFSRAEADIAGVSRTPKLIYGEASGEFDEQKDRFAPTED
jgi:hypothetical protein